MAKVGRWDAKMEMSGLVGSLPKNIQKSNSYANYNGLWGRKKKKRSLLYIA